MLKTLRWKFIKMAMGSLLIVFLVLLLAINCANYIRVNENLEEKLVMLQENRGRFPEESITATGTLGMAENPADQRIHDGTRPWMTPETRFETRFFQVTGETEGIAVDLEFIAAVTQEEAQSYYQQVIEEGKQFGFCDVYKYYSFDTDEGSHTVIFLDANRELQSMWALLKTSAAVGALGVCIMLLLVLFFSRIVLRPVAESIEKQKQFITDASHEIKTPIGIISANNDVLALQYGDNEWLESSRRQTARLKGLMADMVSLTRLDEVSPKLEMEEFSLSEAVLDTAADFTGEAEGAGKQIRAKVAPQVLCRGSEASIRQLLAILLDNAVKYGDEGGEITVCLEQKRKTAVLEVENPCRELDTANLNRVFDRFYRADSSRSQKSGYGIGLSLAQAIVKAHGGKISVGSEDGTSVRFTVELTEK